MHHRNVARKGKAVPAHALRVYRGVVVVLLSFSLDGRYGGEWST
jgi:hypothetical protein